MTRSKLACALAVSTLLAIMLVAIAGCGGGTTTPASTDTTPTTPTSTGTSPTTPASTGTTPTEKDVGVVGYPGTSPEQVYAGVYKMVTADGYDKVVEFYKKAEPGAVFSEITIPTGKGASFVVDTADFHGNISVEENLPESGKVTITVSKTT
jgi:hypothetical protein